LAEAVEKRSPPFVGGKGAKLFFATQAAVSPPTLVVFCNDPQLVSPNYRRYLSNFFRERLPFAEVPIRMLFRARGEGLPNDGRLADDAALPEPGADARPPRSTALVPDGGWEEADDGGFAARDFDDALAGAAADGGEADGPGDDDSFDDDERPEAVTEVDDDDDPDGQGDLADEAGSAPRGRSAARPGGPPTAAP
jgi:hypothetical protein